MSADRRTTQWAERYSLLLRSHLESMGSNVSAAKRALAETISTLQCELAVLQDKLASGGRGGDAGDLTLFLKLSSTVAELLESAGLKQSTTVDHSGDAARDKLAAAIHGLIRARELEEAAGVFRDGDGSVIV